MNIAITFRHMESTEAVKRLANEKISKLQRFLRHPLKAQVVLSTQHLDQIVEVDLHAGSEHFHAHDSSEDLYASIDRVIDKLEAQIRSSKDQKIHKKGQDRASDHLMADLSGTTSED